MENYHQKSKWSRFCVMTTTIILIVVVVIAFMPLYNIAERNNIAISIVCGIALIEMIVMELYYCPVSIIVTQNQLLIRRFFTSKNIPLNEIASVEIYSESTRFLKVCGSGGMFGFYGWYKNKELGRFFIYATNLKELICITLISGKKYMISCEDARNLYNEINHRLSNIQNNEKDNSR